MEDDNRVKEKEIKVSSVPLSSRVISRCMTHSNRRKVAMNSSSRQASFEDLGKQFEVKRPHRRHPSIPRYFLRSNGITGKFFKVIIRDQKGRSWPVNITSKNRLGNGWSEFVSTNSLKEEDICVFKQSNSGKLSNRSGALVLDFTVLSSKNRGALVKKDYQIELSNPSFEKTLTLFNFRNHCLYVPMNFSRLNGLMGKKCKTTLTDGKGRSWKVELNHRKSDDQVYILSDWIQICTSNGLKEGDTCTFELTRKGKRKVMEFSLL
ncbi:putative B3 domain-containing protein REM15 [Telopea speciosissima]|uniref:putative B3 domain-containing protein REM15 n=1 Tax=Telopea speciosissima TaxID=54955 RepID=UPI001CC63C88|nr:putative B3 domain-containing protein REM15 [Telopea speciosissima]